MTPVEILIFVGIILATWLVAGGIYLNSRMKEFQKERRALRWYEIVTVLPWWVAARLAKLRETPAEKEG